MKNKIRIAQVGAFHEFSDGDMMRVGQSILAIGKIDNKFLGRPEHDIINLIYGRDFLTENKKYDVVILHSIYHPAENLDVNNYQTGIPECSLSPRHSVENWRKRLVGTAARFIIIFEVAAFTLNGWQIGSLEGYEILERDAKFTFYQKLDLKS